MHTYKLTYMYAYMYIIHAYTHTDINTYVPDWTPNLSTNQIDQQHTHDTYIRIIRTYVYVRNSFFFSTVRFVLLCLLFQHAD